MRIKMWKAIPLVAAGLVLAMAGCQKSGEGSASAKEKNTEETLVEKSYESKDGSLAVTLPGDQWNLDEDSENLHIFSSAMGTVSFSRGENVSDEKFAETQDDLDRILEIEGYGSDFEVANFRSSITSPVKIWSADLSYTGKDDFYDKVYFSAVLTEDEVYMATAMVTDKDAAADSFLKQTISSYQWQPKTNLSGESNKAAAKEAAKAETGTPSPSPSAAAQEAAAQEAAAQEAAAQKAAQEAAAEQAAAQPAPIADSAITPLNRAGVCKSSAYVRSGPGTAYAQSGAVSEGETFTITGEYNNWFRINYSGGSGFVCKDYVK